MSGRDAQMPDPWEVAQIARDTVAIVRSHLEKNAEEIALQSRGHIASADTVKAALAVIVRLLLQLDDGYASAQRVLTGGAPVVPDAGRYVPGPDESNADGTHVTYNVVDTQDGAVIWTHTIRAKTSADREMAENDLRQRAERMARELNKTVPAERIDIRRMVLSAAAVLNAGDHR